MLAKDPSEISILDILQAEEGPLKLNHCLIEEGFCHREAHCSAHEVWAEAQQEMVNVLKKHNLAELVKREKIKLGKLQ